MDLLSDFFAFGVMVIITLAVVITVHEYGHYIAARLCGVHVETFAFGFGREVFGLGGGAFKTRWSVRLFPIGGYVKLFGDVDKDNPVVWDHDNNCKRTLSDAEMRVAYCTKTVAQRMFIVLAGPMLNIILAYGIFMVMFTTYGQASRLPVINTILYDSAAYEAGVQIGDVILEMDGKPIRRLNDVHDITWRELPPVEHEYTIKRGDDILRLSLTARHVNYFNDKGVEMSHGQTGMVHIGAIMFKDINFINDTNTLDMPDKARDEVTKSLDGIVRVGLNYKNKEEGRTDLFLVDFPSVVNQHLFDPQAEYYDRAFLNNPDYGFYVKLNPFEAWNSINLLIYEGIVNSYKVVKATFMGRNSDPVVGGVAKISEKTGEAFQAGFYSYMTFIAIFSLMIAIINLLPIPVLDGGYLVFLLYEMVTGKALPSRVQDVFLIVGLAILLVIMIFANISDLISLINPVE